MGGLRPERHRHSDPPEAIVKEKLGYTGAFLRWSCGTSGGTERHAVSEAAASSPD